MTSSMTSFTRQQAEFDWGTLVWEIRSVNHRYLDASIRLPDVLRHLETRVRDRLRGAISRGKLEAQLKLNINQGSSRALMLNEALLDDLLRVEAELRSKLTGASALNTLELLKYPGVLQETEQNTNAIEKETLTLFEKALTSFQESREREGTEMAAVIAQRLDGIKTIVADIRRGIPDIIKRQRERLNEQVSELAVNVDPQRLEQEVVLLTQKADIHEELDRLETHIRETGRVLATNEPVGRRLDFLMQELNREANTICSKAVVTDTTLNAVELKVLIEQMREQVQNIE
jgi:uncharacterized protein (TIGR00255 family)